MKWRLPGPQVPAQAVRRPVRSASAPAANAPASRVADDAVARLHAGCLQRFDQKISYSFTHSGTSGVAWPHKVRLALASALG
jgi:hypothetical protein